MVQGAGLPVQHIESNIIELDVATDCSLDDSEEHGCQSSDSSDNSDIESDSLERLHTQKERKISDKLTEYKELHNSMTFKNIPEARKFINMYSLANGYGLKQLKSFPQKLRYRCLYEDCPFVCHIFKDSKGPSVKFKTLKEEHKCNTAYDNHMVNAKTIAVYFKRGLQDNPKIKIKEMMASVKATFNINVSHSKCKRAKRIILEKMECSFAYEYNKVEAYASELRSSNPGTAVVINISKDALIKGKGRFLRMYICFHALKMGFKSGLRPFIGLDGTFLKVKCRGQLLVAVAQDSMRHFYPLAWVVVDKETEVTWSWFLRLLQHSLDLKMGEGITLILDMQKGLIDSVHLVLPEAHHRYCEDFKDQLRNMTQVDEDGKEVVEHLIKYPPESWSRAYFDTVCKNYSMDNNLTESFNSWIKEARFKPIIKVLEDIKVKVMNLLREHEFDVMSWNNDFSAQTMQLYNQYLKIANKCHIHSKGQEGYEVSEDGGRHTVNMVTKICTCRMWDLNRIPCPYAIKAMQHTKVNPLTEIHRWYFK
uniref:Zinc finger PMZ-type domain-containing protein n=2 Tax=Nicotiana TaxID=4085 RepID=A0A1S4BBC5_TOBAC|nr:PREDICTED: uncharacterized protein LOC104210595 [Nicotiana sylvestris]XP_016486230.1 PREDICTED: uncharacterized protein LOC107806574 [Nicotiana tabacum]